MCFLGHLFGTCSITILLQEVSVMYISLLMNPISCLCFLLSCMLLNRSTDCSWAKYLRDNVRVNYGITCQNNIYANILFYLPYIVPAFHKNPICLEEISNSGTQWGLKATSFQRPSNLFDQLVATGLALGLLHLTLYKSVFQVEVLTWQVLSSCFEVWYYHRLPRFE